MPGSQTCQEGALGRGGTTGAGKGVEQGVKGQCCHRQDAWLVLEHVVLAELRAGSVQ